MVGESSVNCEEFMVMDVVVSFSIVECLGVEPYRYVFATVVLLGEDGPCGKGRDVNLELKRFREVGLMKGWVI